LHEKASKYHFSQICTTLIIDSTVNGKCVALLSLSRIYTGLYTAKKD